MQWSDDPNAGFTSAKAAVRPVIESPPFDYKNVNVERQFLQENSLLAWTMRMVRLRKSCPEISYGDWEIVPTPSNKVLAIKYQWNGKHLLIIHNFSSEPERINVNNELKEYEVKNLLDDSSAFEPLADEMELAGYDYRWYQVNIPVASQ